MQTIIALLNAEVSRLYGEGLNPEQIECLQDPERYDEAIDMIDDMEARCGISSYVRGEVADALTQRETVREVEERDLREQRRDEEREYFGDYAEQA